MKWINIIIRALIFPLLVFVFHIFIYLAGAYESYPWIDIPMHLLGGFSVAFMYILIISFLYKEKLLLKMPFLIFFTFVISLVCLTAVLWEFYEYILDFIFNIGAQPNLDDTLLDILMGLIGGVLSFLLFRNYPKALR